MVFLVMPRKAYEPGYEDFSESHRPSREEEEEMLAEIMETMARDTSNEKCIHGINQGDTCKACGDQCDCYISSWSIMPMPSPEEEKALRTVLEPSQNEDDEIPF